MHKKEIFTLKLPCKPYTRKFVESNFGKPANLALDAELNESLRAKLIKPSHRRDKQLSAGFKKYTDNVTIQIDEDLFYRYGWTLSDSDILRLNRQLEARAKLLLMSVVTAQVNLGFSLIKSVEFFQERFGYTEDIWKRDSIIKECQRNEVVSAPSFHAVADALTDKIVEKLKIGGYLPKK